FDRTCVIEHGLDALADAAPPLCRMLGVAPARRGLLPLSAAAEDDAGASAGSRLTPPRLATIVTKKPARRDQIVTLRRHHPHRREFSGTAEGPSKERSTWRTFTAAAERTSSSARPATTRFSAKLETITFSAVLVATT